MGSLLGLCIPDGQPCSGSELVARRANQRDKDSQTVRLIDSAESTTSDSIDDHFREVSIYKVPTKKIAIAPVIANYILLNEWFISVREKMEESALKLEDIERVLYKKDHWLIQGNDAIALEEYRDLFDIVIWKIPTIPAFAHFKTEEEFYEKLQLLQCDDDTAGYKCGIWSILSKEKFIEMFDTKLLNEIDEICDETHAYLADEVKFPAQSEEYEILIEKLKIIQVFKKANDIIIIGQKVCVQDMLREIRKKEVDHLSMRAMFKLNNQNKKYFEWEIKCNDENAPNPNIIVSYSCIVNNVPLHCGQPQIQKILTRYSQWMNVKIIQQDEDTDNERMFKIEFDQEEGLARFINDVEKGNLYLNGNKLGIKSHKTETKPRKIRRLNAGFMIV